MPDDERDAVVDHGGNGAGERAGVGGETVDDVVG